MDQVVDQLWRAHRGRLSLNSSASAVPLDGPFDSARGADERPRRGRAAELDDVRAGAYSLVGVEHGRLPRHKLPEVDDGPHASRTRTVPSEDAKSAEIDAYRQALRVDEEENERSVRS